MSFPVFKEWHAIVNALANGDQSLILRKGGISEGRGGFQVTANRFWLMPTFFHTQREKLKASAEKWQLGSATSAAASGEFTLTCFAEVVAHRFIADWDRVAALGAFHHWTEATVQERFNWSKPPGIHAIVVRVFRLDQPITVSATPEVAGCKSWVEISQDFNACNAKPALTDPAFQQRSSTLQSLW